MTDKGKRPGKLAPALPVESAPYDPLDLRTLAASMAKVVLEQPVHPLEKVPLFEGAGVYVIYHTGDYEPYKSIAQKNKGDKWEQPIYVGEAARKGARKGGVLVEGPAGRVLFNRLKNHADSIRNTNNLKVDDFWCRYLPTKDFFIPLCESLLIDRYTPIWNKVIDGFGNKVVGAGRDGQLT
jgi:Eco29kI restriction endonuclease